MTDERERTDAELARDLLLAETVMGAVWNPIEENAPVADTCTHQLQFKVGSRILAEKHSDGRIQTFAGIPEYHRDLVTAWTVHQAMCDQHYTIRNDYMQQLQDQALSAAALNPKYEGYINHSSHSGAEWVDWRNVLIVLQHDMPAAICAAALKTMKGRGG